MAEKRPKMTGNPRMTEIPKITKNPKYSWNGYIIAIMISFQGLDLDEPDSEGERQLRLQRVAEEWDNLLGRSQDSNDLSSKGIEFLNPAGTTTEAQMSNDSMRTMFSNSVNVPAGTLREVVTQSDTKKSE